ncbi:MAP3K epsilon protein kinase 1-like isoform X2 [Telopea speciosissima]|uniref:MAP3K epsilon protein kinase 1-like isoform X2 n=1 Tax=Telopea speciosissima TaxID=54955 RepID=UPI001CC81B2B|nr:MAP3K epsilon protein kinase 1-like isoform X2 [Telopea speciosissima]
MSRKAATSQLNKSKMLDNKYMLGDEIGKGAYARVYKGLDLENGDFVAIKQVSLENIAQEGLNIIMQEIDLLKILNHKNIVKYLGSSKTKTHLHIILEYVENGSLANIIKPNKFGPFPESLVALYIAQVLEGLVYLHEQGVIHRDIKGANILTTKEGLVKLADFGVATKLTEADGNNTYSVAGTPYWMAPEVIEMSGVCAASDIWSVGCTVIELLTCVPPYFDIQPMPALFRIVQDEHPPIPEHLSPGITDFLCQCFKKDARQRPDAKTLLLHPWIQKSRRALSSLRQSSGTIRNLQEDVSTSVEISNADIQSTGENPPRDKTRIGSSEFGPEDSANKFLATDAVDKVKSVEDCESKDNIVQECLDNSKGLPSDKDPTLVFHDKSYMRTSSGRLLSTKEETCTNMAFHEQSNMGYHNKLMPDGEVVSLESQRTSISTSEHEGKGGHMSGENNLLSVGPKIQEVTSQKAAKASVNSGGEPSKFSDAFGDTSLNDLCQPLDKTQETQAAEASTSASSSQMNQGSAIQRSARKNDLATKLRDRISQKQMDNERGHTNEGDLLRLMMDVLGEDVIDVDSFVFDEKMPGDNLFPLQAVEFSRLVGSLRPDEQEDVIVSACQKLMAFFHERPEQKIVFVTRHGLLPLVELLEVPKTRVTCSVLEIINQIIKDNADFQEKACLVGLIPVVMSFAVPDRPWEVRMQAAYFFQQLCQSCSLTLEMFIACRGIPVLVGFLEADYAKYREMIHLAIDGIWQVFKLHRSTPRNDFCRIAAKNGILIRLINTLHSLNEATRLASMASGDYPSSAGTFEPSRASTSHSQRSDGSQLDSRYIPGEPDKPWSSNDVMEPSISSKFPEPKGLENIGNLGHREPATKDWELLDQRKTDPSRTEVDLKQQQLTTSSNRTSTDKSPKQMESNGFLTSLAPQQDRVQPLLGLLDKEPPSRRFSGKLEFVRHLSGLERNQSIKPLLHASAERRTNGELDFLRAEFSENENMDCAPRMSHKAVNKKVGPMKFNDGAASASGIASRTTSGVLSGSGVLNARPGSTASSGLLSHMVLTMNTDVAKEYFEKVTDLLLEFSQADTIVKSYMCSQSLLSRLFQMFDRIESPILLKLLKCIDHLSTDPNCLENLQRADAIKHLIPNLECQDGPLVSQIHNEVLNALFNLCKINKKRQEQAAENGIIPHLMCFITSDSPLKQYALPLLCDMAHASHHSREQLRFHGGLDVYLSLLDDEPWSVTALDSLAVCLGHDNDNRKVEQALLKKEAVHKLVNFFQYCPEQHFVHILEPFLKIITKSARLNTALAVNGLTPLLIARLDHQDAIARLNLLKMIKAVYEHHPRPKQLIVENELPQKLQNLIEERSGPSCGGQVLVKQMATALLKALHINTVL